MNPITLIQQRVLECIHAYHAKNGFMPTRAEISQVMGWRSPNSAEEHLQALQRKGFVTQTRGAVRSMQFTDAALQLLNPASSLPRTPDMLALPVVDMAKVNLSIPRWSL